MILAHPFTDQTAITFSRHRHRHRQLRLHCSRILRPIVYESQASGQQKLKIAIVGFGSFGQFLARTFSAQGHSLLAHSRSDHSAAAESLNIPFFRDPHDLCEQHPDVVLLSPSILSFASVLRSLPVHSLRRDTLFVDVLPVKEFPKNLLLHHLPPHFDILCTHPMFGPESATRGWSGLPFIYDRIRILDQPPSRAARCDRFLDIFAREGCRMVEMPCADHDKSVAEIQLLTHTVGRWLTKLDLRSTPISTKGYETLLELVDSTCSDSLDLYSGLFMYNKNATQLLERLDDAFDELKRELFGRLHGVLGKHMLESPADKV